MTEKMLKEFIKKASGKSKITAPKVIIALYFPVFAHFLATRGISNAPGHQTTSILVSSTPCRFSSSIAPDNSLPPINSLNLEIMMQNFLILL